MVKCSGKESRMTRGRIFGSSTKTSKGEKPSEPFIPLPWLALPKSPSGNFMQENKWAEKEVFEGVFPLTSSTTFPWWLFPPFFLLDHEFLYLLYRVELKRETWLWETGSHHMGSGATRCHSKCCIRAGETWASYPWHRPDSIVPRLMLCDPAASSSEVCCIHRFRNQLDGREWTMGSFGAPIRACHL